MIRIITAYAKISRLSRVHPFLKILLTIVPVVIMGFAETPYVPVLNSMLFIVLHSIYKNPRDIVLKFTLSMGIFAMVSSIVFIFDYGPIYCLVILLRSLSSGLSISFLVLTTPLDDVLCMLSKFKGIRDICDISKSMERFLILIEDEFKLIFISMKSRGGFQKRTEGVKNIGKAIGLVFVNTIRRWTEVREGINSRCYSGTMPYLAKKFEFSCGWLLTICLYNGLLIAILIFGRG
jgi:cobalt/nickel transport system permease protein